MKKRYYVLAAVLLLLAAAAGALIPYAACTVHDRLTAGSVVSYDVDWVRIDCSSYTVAEKLQLYASGTGYVISDAGSPILSQTEATEAAQRYLTQLLPGLTRQPSSSFCSINTAFFDGNASLLLWSVTLEFSDFSADLVVDDASSAVLSYQLHNVPGEQLLQLLGQDPSAALIQLEESGLMGELGDIDPLQAAALLQLSNAMLQLLGQYGIQDSYADIPSRVGINTELQTTLWFPQDDGAYSVALALVCDEYTVGFNRAYF